MGTLCQFFFDVLVDLNFTFERFNLIQQFVVLGHNDFCLLTLQFQFISQLVILEHGKTCSLGELLVVQRE